MKIASIILAGGKNRRLGRNKALEPIGGKAMIERVIERLKPLTSQILIVTAREQPDLPVADKAEILVDLYPGKGPLGGIYTGLSVSQCLYNLVVACDMPFLNTELLRYIVKLGLSHGSDVVMPRLGEGKLEPLHALYSRNCLSNIRTQLERNELKAYSFLNTVSVRYVEQAECQRFDPRLLSFFNINSQSDLDQAVTLASMNVHDSGACGLTDS